MGEAFISKKRERFQHQNDAAKTQELESENLFSLLPDLSTTVYRCDMDGETLPVATDIIAVAALDAGRLSVLLRNVVIGHVKPQDAKLLTTILEKSHHKMLVGVVDCVRRRSRTFTIRIDAQ